MGHDEFVIGAIVIVVVITFVLPVTFFIAQGIICAALGWALQKNAEHLHEGSELINTDY